MPEKSGIDAALGVLLPAGAFCPKAGIAAPIANVTTTRKSSRRAPSVMCFLSAND
jgi:hypothetical protein